MPHKTIPIHAQPGFSLIELLVAVIVLSVGLLGATALQTSTLASNQTNYHKAEALRILADLSERMRANVPGVKASAYLNGSSNGSIATESLTDNPTDCTRQSCTSTQLATHDLLTWAAAVRTLPQGTGTLTKQTEGSCLVTISWTGSSWQQLANARSATVSTTIQVQP